jgi:signal peptidase I
MTADFKKSTLREYFESIVIAVILALFIRTFVVQAFKIPTGSMEETLLIGDHLLVNKFVFGPSATAAERALLPMGTIKRRDILVFKYPEEPERDFIKRVIGLPGETVTVHSGVISIDGQPLDEPYISAPPTYENSWTLGPDQYFVLGDNRNSSSDSHSWGPLDRHYLIGRAIFVYWPPTLWGTVPHYTYADAPERTAQPVATASQIPGQNGYPAYP